MEEIFDMFLRASELSNKADAYKEAKKDSALARKENCGHCAHWMKSNRCPLEKNVNGRNTGPSMNYHGCSEFTFSSMARDFIRQTTEKELKLKAELIKLVMGK